jgi:hypothetical protein
MKRSLISSVFVFLITALVGTALTSHAQAANGSSCAAPQADRTVYWAN